MASGGRDDAAVVGSEAEGACVEAASAPDSHHRMRKALRRRKSRFLSPQHRAYHAAALRALHWRRSKTCRNRGISRGSVEPSASIITTMSFRALLNPHANALPLPRRV